MYAKALVVSSILILAATASGALAEESQPPEERHPGLKGFRATPPVSLIRLVAACEDFEGQSVMTTGVASFDFENFSLCPSTEIARHDPKSCFWLQSGEEGIPAERLESLKQWSKSWVSIEAAVGCAEHLHAGSLEKIEFIVEHDKGTVLWSTDPALQEAPDSE